MLRYSTGENMKYIIYTLTLVIGLNVQAFTVQGENVVDKGEINLETQKVDPVTLNFKNNSLTAETFSPTISNPNFKISLNRCLNVASNKTCAITISPQRKLSVGLQEIQVGDALVRMTLVKKDGNGQVIVTPTPSAIFEFVPATLAEIPFTASEKNKTISLSIKNTGTLSEIPNVSWISNLNNAKITINRCSISLAPGKSCSIAISVKKPEVDISQSLQLTYSGAPKTLVFNIKAVPTCVGTNNTDGTGTHSDGNGGCVSNTRLCSNPPDATRIGDEFWVPSTNSWSGTCSNIRCAQGGPEINGQCSNYLAGITLMNDSSNYYINSSYNCSATGSFNPEFLDLSGNPNGNDRFVYRTTNPTFSRTNAVTVTSSFGCNNFPSIIPISSIANFTTGNIISGQWQAEDAHYRTISNHTAIGGGTSYLLKLRINSISPAVLSLYGMTNNNLYIRISSSFSTSLRSGTSSTRVAALNRLKSFTAALVTENSFSTGPQFYYAMNPSKILATENNVYYLGGRPNSSGNLGVASTVSNKEYLFKQKKGRNDSVSIYSNNTGDSSLYSRDLEQIVTQPLDFSIFNGKVVVSLFDTNFTIRTIDDISGTITNTVCSSCTDSSTYSSHRIHENKIYISAYDNSISKFILYRSDDGINFSKIFERLVGGQDVLAYSGFFGNYMYYYDHENNAKIGRLNLTTLATESIEVTFNTNPLNYRLWTSTFSVTKNFIASLVKDDSNNWYLVNLTGDSVSFSSLSLNHNGVDEPYFIKKANEQSILYLHQRISENSVDYLRYYDGSVMQTLQPNESNCFRVHFVNQVTGNAFVYCVDGTMQVFGKNGYIKTIPKNYESEQYSTSDANMNFINPYFSKDTQVEVIYKGKQYLAINGLDNNGNILGTINNQDEIEIVSGGNCQNNSGTSSETLTRVYSGATLIVNDNNLYFAGNTCRGESDEAGYGNSNPDINPNYSGYLFELQKLYVP